MQLLAADAGRAGRAAGAQLQLLLGVVGAQLRHQLAHVRQQRPVVRGELVGARLRLQPGGRLRLQLVAQQVNLRTEAGRVSSPARLRPTARVITSRVGTTARKVSGGAPPGNGQDRRHQQSNTDPTRQEQDTADHNDRSITVHTQTPTTNTDTRATTNTRATGKHRRSEAHHRRLMPPLPRGDTEAHGWIGPVGGVQSVYLLGVAWLSAPSQTRSGRRGPAGRLLSGHWCG